MERDWRVNFACGGFLWQDLAACGVLTLFLQNFRLYQIGPLFLSGLIRDLNVLIGDRILCDQVFLELVKEVALHLHFLRDVRCTYFMGKTEGLYQPRALCRQLIDRRGRSELLLQVVRHLCAGSNRERERRDGVHAEAVHRYLREKRQTFPDRKPSSQTSVPAAAPRRFARSAPPLCCAVRKYEAINYARRNFAGIPNACAYRISLNSPRLTWWNLASLSRNLNRMRRAMRGEGKRREYFSRSSLLGMISPALRDFGNSADASKSSSFMSLLFFSERSFSYSVPSEEGVHMPQRGRECVCARSC